MSKTNFHHTKPAQGAGLEKNGVVADSFVALAEKIKSLVRLAQEQGQLTFDDVNEVLTDEFSAPAQLDHVYAKLRELEIEVVEAAEVDHVKPVDKDDAEEDEHRLDTLDDPVRMYLKQMGAVPLLTREQEVEISKRIEAAENVLRQVVYSFGFAGKEHIALAEKLLADPPRERFDRVVLDKKIHSRDAHTKALRRLVVRVRELDHEVDQHFNRWRDAHQNAKRNREHDEFSKLDQKLAGAVSQVLFQAEGCRGNGAGGRKHPRQNAIQPARARRRAEPARIQRAKTPGRGRAANAAGAGGIRADAASGFLAGVRPAGRRRRAGAAGQDGNGRGQPAARHLHRQKIHQPRAVVPRPDSGRQHRPDEGRGKI